MAVYTDKGLFRANPNATNENNLRLVHPTTPGTSEQDEATDIDIVTGPPVAYTGIEYTGADGVTQDILFDTDIPVANWEEDLRYKLLEIIGQHEVDTVIQVSFSTPNLTVTHYGSGTLSELYVDGASGGTFART